MTIVEPAPAKLNLALHLRRRRADGYHDLETVFAFARDGDVVTATPAERWTLAITGPFAASLPACSPAQAGAQPSSTLDAAASIGAPRRAWTPAFAGEHNLMERAANRFVEAFPDTPPHALTLEKNLPIASGIGGGSADAAATLRALARSAGVDVAAPALFTIAAALGADVPACLRSRPAFGVGKGEALAPLPPLGDVPVLLVNPGEALATAPVFAGWDGVDRGPLDAAAWRAGRNDLEAPARALVPAIGDVLAWLVAQRGVTLARVSGSGATCFALFDAAAARDAAAAALRTARPAWWCLATTLS